VIFENYSGLLV